MPTATAPAAPTPVAATPPKINQGRRGQTLPDDYLQSVVEILKGLDNGDVALTGARYPEKNAARKASELLRRELVRIDYVDDKAKLSTRVWQDGEEWLAGVGVKP